jgi:hypothetical protein
MVESRDSNGRYSDPVAVLWKNGIPQILGDDIWEATSVFVK